MRWRKWLHALHRDFGFFAIGLTLVYAISGIAVNHREDWNYNLSTTHEARALGVPSALLEAAPGGDEGQLARDREDELVSRITATLGRPAPRKAFWRGPDRLSLFFGPGESDVVDYQPSDGSAQLVTKTERPLVREMNYLHLNEGRGAWTWIADAFAVILIFLAISGALIVRGKRGLRGRGGVLTALGVLLPVIAVLMMR
ncbi:MAG: hypothetical protein EP329_12725 [Deltaproteobacteria bacterium]|nr:MAG: hypothetical protein EP329_12725 [Deltaproteobacteria bacterium]